VLVASHLSEMALTADHLLVIGKGRLIADTSADEFVRCSSRQSVHVSSPRRPSRLVYSRARDVPDRSVIQGYSRSLKAKPQPSATCGLADEPLSSAT
jgi:ABC-type multidrug transport system ATPase subunit